jgi:type IX secretion system PorP/SprF family membrane protein
MNKMKFKFLLILTFGLSCFLATAQQTTNYTQYNNVVIPINTAASFLTNQSQVNLVGRYQWVGLEGAPTSYRLAASLPLAKSDLRLGINLKQESAAVENVGEATFFLGKAVRLSAEDYLALSLGVGLSYFNGNFSRLSVSDPSFANDLKEIDGMLSVGLMYYRPEKFYAGISVPRLTFSKLGLSSKDQNYDVNNLYHFTAGAVFALGSDFDLKPATLISYAKNLDFQGNLSAMLYLKKTFGLGADVKTQGEMAALASIFVKNLNIGFGYQFATSNNSENRIFSNSTYEFSLTYRFGKGFGGLL